MMRKSVISPWHLSVNGFIIFTRSSFVGSKCTKTSGHLGVYKNEGKCYEVSKDFGGELKVNV